MNWIEKLARVVDLFDKLPLGVQDESVCYHAEQPENTPWPIDLPTDDDLAKYYSVFGGGEIGPMIRLTPRSNLRHETDSWIETLRGDAVFETRVDVSAVVAVGRESDGTPWFYDTSGRWVQAYYWREARWLEPRLSSLPEFVEFVFTGEDGDEEWAKLLSHAGI